MMLPEFSITGAPIVADAGGRRHRPQDALEARGEIAQRRDVFARDPDLDRDAPWKSLIKKPANLSDGWSRLRADWWGIDWTSRDARLPGTAIFSSLALGAIAAGQGLRRRSSH